MKARGANWPTVQKSVSDPRFRGRSHSFFGFSVWFFARGKRQQPCRKVIINPCKLPMKTGVKRPSNVFLVAVCTLAFT